MDNQATETTADAQVSQAAQSAGADEWSWWRDALADKRGVDTERGNPRSGYYRVKGEAIAFWRHDGDLCVWRSGSFPAPTKADAQDELFGWCAPHPVAYEAFEAFRETGRWPDEVAPVEVDSSLAPHERADAELTAQREAMAAWVRDIGKIETQEQATKAGNFADEFAKIEGRATAAHKAEKAPHLEAGRVVDAAWKPVIARADELKRWAKKASEPFLIAERDRIRAEEKVAADARAKVEREAAERRRQAEAAGTPPPAEEPRPMPAPPPVKAKAGKVHLRSVTKHEIVDLRAVLSYLADFNDPPRELIDAVQLLVNRMRHAGVAVPGVETKTVEVAA